MSNPFIARNATILTGSVNLLQPELHLGLPCGQGAASAAQLAILGTWTDIVFALRGEAQLFECSMTRVAEAILVEISVPGSELGIPVRTSSLSDGLVVFAVENEEVLGATRVRTGDLELDVGGDLLKGSATQSLTQIKGVLDKAVIYAMSQRARVSDLVVPSVVLEFGKYSLILDGVYSGIVEGDSVMVEVGPKIVPCSVASSTVAHHTLEGLGIQVPLTSIDIPDFGVDLFDAQKDLKIWFNAVQAGELVRLPATTASSSQILASAALDPVANAPLAIVDATGTAILVTTDEIPDTPLTLPATIYTNLALATRGETIKNEPLGSGDASVPFQSFRLKKSPLTYLADPTAPNGRRSTLEVHVNGQKWRQAQSFYGALPTDQIYVVRHDEDHQTHIVFGDGELGQRLPTGSNNVVATYRFGVGGNVPANSITALKKPIKGIRKVFNPLPATGGKEPPTPEQMRREAPLGLLVLGRLVSLPDFEAETRRYGNVVNAKARWGWDEAGEDAQVQVWFATRDEGDPSADLRIYLEAMAEPNTRVSATKATPTPGVLMIDLVVDPRHKAEDVELEVAKRLFDDWDGVLSVRNMPIGGRLHRSKLYAAIHAVPGVLGIDGITVDGAELPPSLPFAEGTYLDLENADLIVGSTEAGKRLFGTN